MTASSLLCALVTAACGQQVREWHKQHERSLGEVLYRDELGAILGEE